MTYLKGAFFTALLACSSLIVHAQDYAKKTIGGEDYFVYYVEPGNTLFAISKMFSVPVEAIVEANAGVDQGLSIGQELLVPVREVNKREAKKKEVKVEGDILLHTVQKKETLFSISKVYGVSVNDLIELNPEAEKTLSTGVVLKIPTEKSTSVEEVFVEPAANDSFIVHQVQGGETVYSLAKQYGLVQDSLVKMNPDIESGLKVGQYLVIPAYTEEFLEEKLAAEKQRRIDELGGPVGKKDRYKIGLMLPFEFELTDSLEQALKRGEDLFILTEIALEYYRGTLLAMDSLAELGLNADLYIYDVSEDIVHTRETLRRPEIKELDLIFGPMHRASLGLVSELASKEQIYLVSPISFSNEVFEENPYLMRATASQETMLRYLANYIAINHQHENVLMVNSESPKGWPLRKEFVKNYNLAASTFVNHLSDSLRSVTKTAFEGTEKKIYQFLSKDTTNILVIPSNDLAFVSEMMTKVALLDDEYDIQVYGLDEWVKYENIEAEYKNRLNLRLVVPSFVDYKAPITVHFLEKYREKYGTEPSSFAFGFKGYDLAMFFGKALIDNGLAFPAAFRSTKMAGTAGSYRFGKSTTGKEFENKEAYILEYKDYKVSRIN